MSVNFGFECEPFLVLLLGFLDVLHESLLICNSELSSECLVEWDVGLLEREQELLEQKDGIDFFSRRFVQRLEWEVVIIVISIIIIIIIMVTELLNLLQCSFVPLIILVLHIILIIIRIAFFS